MGRLLVGVLLLITACATANAQVANTLGDGESVGAARLAEQFGALEGAPVAYGSDETTLSADGASSALHVTDDGLIVMRLAPENFRSASLIDLESQTIRFTPANGGYTAEAIDLQFEANIGAYFDSYGGDAWSGSEFTFPFADTVWDRLYINHVGSITFEKKPSPGNGFASLESELPKLIDRGSSQPTISPLYFHQWSTNTYVNEMPDRVVITWDGTWGWTGLFAIEADPQNSASVFQAVLHTDGTIDFNYKSLGTEVGVVGVFPYALAGISDFSGTLLENLEGTYRLDDYTNEYHEGDITLQSGTLRWTNRAGVTWELDPAQLVSEGVLETIDSPYESYDQEWEFFEFSMLSGVIIGFEYLGEFYVRQSEEVAGLREPGKSVDFTADIDRELSGVFYEAFLYPASPDLSSVACSVLPEVGDNYDFMVMYSQFRMDKVLAGSGMVVISNSIEGIGLDQFSRSDSYCSDGRLTSAIGRAMYIDALQGTPAGPNGANDNYNFAMSQLGHELGHNWIANVSAVVDGETLKLTDDGCNCHWAQGLHAPVPHSWKEARQASAMGGGYWIDNNDGTFTQIADAYFVPASGFSYLDLYLMGLIGPERVPDFFIIQDLLEIRTNEDGYKVFSGERVDLTIDNIIASEGPRVPDWNVSQKAFETAFVYVLAPGEEADPEKLGRLGEIRDEFSAYWNSITGRASSMNSAQASHVLRVQLEEPVEGEIHTGVGNLRGWAVADLGIDKIEIWIDDEYAFDVPYGGARGDVGNAFPDIAGSGESGFSMAFAYSALAAGAHTAKAVAYDSSGSVKESAISFSVVKFEESFIADPNAVDLSNASCSVSGDEVSVTDAVVSSDPLDMVLKWRTAEQGFEIIEIQGSGAGVAMLQQRQAMPARDAAANTETSGAALKVTLEEPVSGEIHGGVGNLRGWAVASQGIEKIEIYIDGGYAFDAPYGGARGDVGAAFPEVPNATESGVSLAFAYSNLAAGSHTIEAVARATDGQEVRSAATFEVVKFAQNFISDPQAVNLDGAACTTEGDAISITGAVVAGETYDMVLDWRTAEQGFEIVEIR